MTLATTCPRCKTSFKVVADQLKLRRGMVRCGVCQTVFSGLEQLRYVEASSELNPEARSPLSSPLSSPNSPAKPIDSDINAGYAVSSKTAAPSQASGIITSMFDDFENTKAADDPQTAPANLDLNAAKIAANLSTNSPPSSIVVSQIPTSDDPRFSPASTAASPSTLLRQDDDLKTAFFLPDHWDATTQHVDANPPVSIQVSNPVFVPLNSVVDQFGNDVREDREAQQAAGSAIAKFNRQDDNNNNDDNAVDFFSSEQSYGTTSDRFSQLTKVMLVGFAALVLIFQLSLVTRNWLAVRVPALAPTLSFLAGAAGLTVELPRNLSALTIESFDVQATARADTLAVSAILRNRSNHAVQWPALELTLTGADGKAILRKILTPTEYLNQTPANLGVVGSTEHPIRIGLLTEGIAPTGYSVKIFYI